MRNLILFLICAGALFWPTAPALAQPGGLTIADRGTFISFPDRIIFNAQVRGTAPIAQIVLEYGVDKRTCGDITARAFPAFSQGQAIDVNWAWEMALTGSEPPGAVIWYRWRVTDTQGNSAVTPDARVTWIDGTYPWRSISAGDLTLHWFEGEPAFARDLLDTTVSGIAQLARLTGVRPQAPINLYIYGTTRQMQDAILYEPSWTGGVAFPANNITIIGINPQNLAWGKRTIVHELTHLIVGQLTFSCGENVPTWLDEGIAVFAEGGLEPYSALRFQAAITSNELLPVRDLSNGFSQHPGLADLSYSQSYSMVDFLVRAYGPDRLLQLFANLRDGMTVEGGMQAAYGFDLGAFEARWRAEIGAAPPASAAPSPAPAPSAIPTYAPLAVAPTGPAIAPTPTSPPATATAEPAGGVSAPAAPVNESAPARQPLSPLDPRLIAAYLVFLIGLGLAGVAGWKLVR